MTVVGRASSVTPAGMVASQPGAMADRSSRTALLAAVAAAGLLASVLAGCAGIATPSPSAAGSPSGTASGDGQPERLDGRLADPRPSPSAVPSPTPVAYVVATGDTLFSIARRFDTTARSIAYWNRVTYPNLDPESTDYEPDQIRIGWTLTVWPGQEVDEASPPPGPSPTPQPSVVIGPAITPRPDGTSLLVDHGSRDGNAVALTFDLGGRTEPAVAIVRWLIEHDVPATIFPTGETGTTDRRRARSPGPRRRPPRPVRDRQPHLGPSRPDGARRSRPSRPSSTGPRRRSRRSSADRRSHSSDRRSGPRICDVRTAAGAGGWLYTVMWDVDSLDWKPESDGGPTTDDLTARVLARVQGGSIVLMHLGGYHTLEALPDIVAGLADRGLEPVTLPRLLGTD